MLKKALNLTPVAAALALGVFAGSAIAADTVVEHQVQLIATVPTSTFYVQPADSGWIGLPQRMEWNLVQETLDKFRKPFDIKHTAGSIQARLTDTDAYLSNGTNTIPLIVKFNDKVLSSTTPIEIASASEAAAGQRVNLEIAPGAKPAGGFAPGNYSGNVNMTFDAMVTP
ncbi:fimbrial protein [Pseudomonas sp. RIT-PI-S]|uniref:fimbrial protein n=1 Tax=Pseudomonas sp. RIT-PI-S TaxID=3035295 RepID=UPI0021DA1BC8|nr:fimbrial protein [Pseudomonas sp. RIT-PI-S]